MVLLDLTIKNILTKTSKQEIMEAFFGTHKIYGCFSSPLRKDDHPSFSVSRRTLRYTDHVSKETGDCFDLIRAYHNTDLINAMVIATELVGISHLFAIDYSVLNGSRKEDRPEIKGFVQGHTFDAFDLNVVPREIEQHDIDYWGQYGININHIKLGKIVPISKYYMNSLMYVADKYSYAYLEKKDGEVTIKVYQPFKQGFGKWVNNNTFDTWELFYLLPKIGKYLIITSSRKDALAIIANTNIPSTSMQAEGILPKPHVLNEVVGRFDVVFLFYDNDKKGTNWGQENAKKFLEMDPRIINLCIPDHFKSKDFSDLITEIGAYSAVRVLEKMMYDAIESHKAAFNNPRSEN